MKTSIRVLSLNLHKGFSAFNKRFVLHELKEAILDLSVDLVFLQEVIGDNSVHKSKVKAWPEQPQYEFLADSIWKDYAYGKNAVYPNGHHGNAILSKWPIKKWHNFDVSGHASESRGILHCEIQVGERSLHCLCIHFGLVEKFRRFQFQELRKYLRQNIMPDAPTIVAGDFNDWRNRAKLEFAKPEDFQEVFEQILGRPARSFPSFLPVLPLDRIYFRNLHLIEKLDPEPKAWSKLSDHRPLGSVFELSH